MWTYTSSGRIELNITKRQAAIGYHQGQCDEDINELRQVPAIKRQLVKLNPEILLNELKEYGAWNDEELCDHDANLSRILWIMCGNIIDDQ